VRYDQPMCTILIGLGTDARWPLVIAANRDEFLHRRSAPPRVLLDHPRVVGGLDLVAGGTWMGVTPAGFFAGLTNQPHLPGRTAPRSRGEVVLEVLRLGSEARAWLAALPTAEFQPFNLVFGTADGLTVAYARPGEPTWFEEVPPGFHVLPNDTLNSPRFPKVERARALTDGHLESMTLALHDEWTPPDLPPRPPHLDGATHAAVHRLRVRTPVYGTVSATLLALEPGRVVRYAFAAGDGPFAEVTDRVYEAAPMLGDP
jgi:hypothetical protein